MDEERKQGGFTLVEMLCTIVVLLLISALMATGVRVAVQAYRKNIVAAESQVLCTSLRTKISDELHYAGLVGISNDTVTYSSRNYGTNAKIYADSEEGRIFVKSDEGTYSLLPKSSYPYGMTATVAIAATDEDNDERYCFKVTIEVFDGEHELASSTFDVKQLNRGA